MRTSMTFLVAMLACLAASRALAEPGRGNSSAAIAAAFADSCRTFMAQSSKDISHVELHYADGRVVKDESIGGPAYEIAGGEGDELEAAIVKSGTTSRAFECAPPNGAPLARLEIATPAAHSIEGCYDFFAGGLVCEQSTPRDGWTSADEVPDTGGSESGLFHWGCGALTDRSLCSFVFHFRGSDSTDPDGDLALWSLDFGDGTVASGSWATDPPVQLAHDYAGTECLPCVITLTVTDSTGQASSASLRMVFLDQSPD